MVIEDGVSSGAKSVILFISPKEEPEKIEEQV
jgi:hypothetical protein